MAGDDNDDDDNATNQGVVKKEEEEEENVKEEPTVNDGNGRLSLNNNGTDKEKEENDGDKEEDTDEVMIDAAVAAATGTGDTEAANTATDDDEPMTNNCDLGVGGKDDAAAAAAAADDDDGDGRKEEDGDDEDEDEDDGGEDDGGEEEEEKEGSNDDDDDDDGDDDDDDNSQQGDGSSSEEEESDDANDDDNDDDDDNDNHDTDTAGDEDEEGDDGEDNQNQNNNDDGLSEYERLRLARIQRNQERLSALGLLNKGGTKGNGNGGGGSLFGPTDAEAALEKRKRSKKKIIDPNAVPIEPTRTNLSRSSKKRIDYAEKQKLTEEDTSTKKKKKKGESSFYPAVFSSLGFQREKKERKRKNGRKKEKNHKDRVPLFVYQEFRRIKTKRRLGVTQSKKNKRVADKQVKYWRQQVEKVVKEETIYQQRHDREVQLRHQREQQRLRIEQERQEYGGNTKLELLLQLDNMVPQLVTRVNQQNSIRTQALLVSQHNQRKQLEVNSRQALERKMCMIETIDKYPKSYNDALSSLNTLLYSRVPPTREYNTTAKQNNNSNKHYQRQQVRPPTATTANQLRNRNKATAARRKTYDHSNNSRNSGVAMGTATSTTTTVTRKKKRPASSSSLKRPRQEPQSQSQPHPLSLSQYQHQHQQQHQHQYQDPSQQLDPLSQLQHPYSSQLEPLSQYQQHPYTLQQLEPLSQFQHEYSPQQLEPLSHFQPDYPPQHLPLEPQQPPKKKQKRVIVTETVEDGFITTTTTTIRKKKKQKKKNIRKGTTPAETKKKKNTKATTATATATAVGSSFSPTAVATSDDSIAATDWTQLAVTLATATPTQIQTPAALTTESSATATATATATEIGTEAAMTGVASVLFPTSTHHGTRSSSSSSKQNHLRKKVVATNNSSKKNKKQRSTTGDDAGKSNNNSNTTTTKRKVGPGWRKNKDARYVGGWMSPQFSQELDRSWLERTKPLTKTIVVPEDTIKTIHTSSVTVKKTAVFDLQQYVPQAGDIVLYYPSAHKDFLLMYPDTLGSRQRNLARVPLWARANRERNRLSKEPQEGDTTAVNQEKGKIWWTDEWIESLMTVQKMRGWSQGRRERYNKSMLLKEEQQRGEENTEDSTGTTTRIHDTTTTNIFTNTPTTKSKKKISLIAAAAAAAAAAPTQTTSVGDYPIICRVERTHNEFPRDPYATTEHSVKKNNDDDDVDDDDDGTGDNDDTTTMSWSKTGGRTLSPAVAEYKKKMRTTGTVPQIRLAVTLRPLSRIIPPTDDDDTGNVAESSSPYRLALPPNFSVTMCPVRPPLDTFLIPFCWGYTSFHTLSIGESVWIQRSLNNAHQADDSTTKKAGRSKNNMCGGKGKIIDFFVGDGDGDGDGISEKSTMVSAGDQKREERHEISASQSSSSSPARPTPTKGTNNNNNNRLENNIDSIETILASLGKEGVVLPSKLPTNENESIKKSIPTREKNIIIDFLSVYLKQLKSQQAKSGSDSKCPTAMHRPSSSSQPQPDSSSTASIVPSSASSSSASRLLVELILKTLPLRLSVSVTYDSNRRQLHRTSPWNLVTLQPTDLSRTLQEDVLSTLENSMREKAVLSINEVIDTDPQAHSFVPIVTELVAPGYNMCVPVPMSLSRILSRLKPYGSTNSCYYTSMESILVDLTLIIENALLYNNPESDLVVYCVEIVRKCQKNIKSISQNLYKHAKVEKNDNVGGKRHASTIPSDLNTPYKGNNEHGLCGDWLQQIAPDSNCVEVGKRTRQLSSSVWIPQVGDTIFYSRTSHTQFVSGHRDSLADVQCIVPQFQKTDGGTLNENNGASVENQEDYWRRGRVVSVRTSFPRATEDESSFTTVTPILIVELRFYYSQCDGTTLVCWRPCLFSTSKLFSTLATTKCNACELSSSHSFLKPAWMSTEGMQILPSDTSEEGESSLSLSIDTISSIGRCFDFLKQRCMDGVSVDSVDPNLALKNAEQGVTINPNPEAIPSYLDFFTPSSEKKKKGSRGTKKLECPVTLEKLSEVSYMPVWRFRAPTTGTTAEENTLSRHESWMSFPSLCLELIRLRIAHGYYRNVLAVVNDISESYVQSVLFILSGPSFLTKDYVSIRKIAKHLLSAKGNGKMSKIFVRKKYKKKNQSDEVISPTDKKQSVASQKSKSKGTQESRLSEEEEALIRRIVQIRKYHTLAMVFVLDGSQAETLFGLKSMIESPIQAPEPIPDVATIDKANFTPEQLDGIQNIRKILNAIGRDPMHNRFKFVYRNTYKLKIKCGGQIITENGSLETNEEGSILYEPATVTASLPDGSQVNVSIRRGNEHFYAEKRLIDGLEVLLEKAQLIKSRLPGISDASLSNELNHSATSSNVPQPIDTTKKYPPSMVGRNYTIFSWPEFKSNEELVRTLFGRPDRKFPCVRCQANNVNLFDCRVRKCHSNPDYAFLETFKGTTGVDSLLLPWKQGNKDDDEGTTNSNIATAIVTTTTGATNTTKTGSNQLVVVNTEDATKKAAAAIVIENARVEKETLATYAKQTSEARESLTKSDKASKLADYLYHQAGLLRKAKIKLSEDFIKTNFPFDPEDNHYVFCIHCGCAGDLLVCDGCFNVAHPKCVGLLEVPEEDWFCHKCSVKKDLIASDNSEGSVAKPPPPSTMTMTALATEQPEELIAPEINDLEFDEKESELDKLLVDLTHLRVPPPHEAANVEQSQSERVGGTKNPPLIGFDESIDALGDSTTWVRQFLSFISIESGNELLDTKSGAIAKDMEMWRKEKGMKPFNGNSYNTTVSGWKNTIRKANAAKVEYKEEVETDNFIDDNNNDNNDDDEVVTISRSSGKRKRSVVSNTAVDNNSSLRSLPKQGRNFCAYIGIEDGEEFLSTRSSSLVRKYVSWRKKMGMSVLQGSGNSAYIGSWRTKIRNDLEERENVSIQEEEEQVEVAVALPPGFEVPIGFKVRKLFEDGNYYDGEVISGPSTVLDDETKKTVSCWSVKYTDDDEEEFSLEELNMWAVVAITTTATVTSAAGNNDDDDSALVVEPTAKRIKSTAEETNTQQEIPKDDRFTATATTMAEVEIEI